jgi:large conductance mechanosensitive channel
MLKDFRQFIAQGNVLGLAVAVIIGAAFATIVASLTDDLIMPIVGLFFGGLDFSAHFLRLGPIPENYAGSLTSYDQLKAAGVLVWGYGRFISVLVSFLILAFIIFLLVKAASRIMREEEAAPSEEVTLLREIRDELRQR